MHHPYHDALFSWLAARGYTVAESRYPRIVASGETTAYRFSPKSPVARLLILHGTGNDALYPFTTIIQASVAAGVEVVSFDLDGHGIRSTTLLDPRVAVSAVASAVEDLHRNAIDLHLLGHSLGGALAIQAIATGLIPSPKSLTLLATPVRLSPVPHMVVRETISMLSPAFLRAADPASLWSRVPAFGSFKRSHYPIRLAGGDERTFAYVDIVSHMFELAASPTRIKQVTCPLALIYGSADDIAPVSQAEMLRKGAGSSDVMLVTVKGASHLTLPFFKETADAVLARMGVHKPG